MTFDQGLRLAHVDDNSRLVPGDDFGRAAAIGDDHGQAGRLRLQHHVAEGVGGGGKHHGIGTGVGGGQFLAFQEAGKDDGAARTARLEFLAGRPVADQDQAYRSARLQQAVQGVDEQVARSSLATSGRRRGT